MGSTMRTRHGLGWLLALLAVALMQPAAPLHSAGDSAVVAAVKAGDVAAVRALIAANEDVNAPASDSSTALLWAAYNSDVEMTRVLLAAGATVDVANYYGMTPLLQASRTGDTALMEVLLEAGANPALAHPEGETPLMAASQTGRVDAVRLLMARGADVNTADLFQDQTALMWAAAEGHVEVVDTLLEAGADPNLQAYVTQLTERHHGDHPSGGFTALMFAAREGHGDVVRALVANGADLTLTNGDQRDGLLGATAPIIAIINDRFDLAATLFELGADVNDGSLYWAVNMHDATTDMRARDGSRLRANYPNELTALDLIKLLLDRGADPNKPFVGQMHSVALGADGFVNATPFYKAAQAADVEALKLLIAAGAEVEWQPGEITIEGAGRGANSNMYRQAIYLAMRGGRGAAFGGGPGFSRLGPPPFREESNREPVDAVKVLLEAGANPNAWGPEGATPLHMAVQNRVDLDVIRALVDGGADLYHYSQEGLTPLELAERPATGRGRGNAAGDPGLVDERPEREEIASLLRELMGLPPAPPPAAEEPAADEAEPADDAAAADENQGGV